MENTLSCQREGAEEGWSGNLELPDRMIIHRMGKNNKVLLHRWETDQYLIIKHNGKE